MSNDDESKTVTSANVKVTASQWFHYGASLDLKDDAVTTAVRVYLNAGGSTKEAKADWANYVWVEPTTPGIFVMVAAEGHTSTDSARHWIGFIFEFRGLNEATNSGN
jgi:hypothetical protein